MPEKKLGKDKWVVGLSFHTKDEAERYIHKHLLRKGFKEKWNLNFYQTNYLWNDY